MSLKGNLEFARHFQYLLVILESLKSIFKLEMLREIRKLEFPGQFSKPKSLGIKLENIKIDFISQFSLQRQFQNLKVKLKALELIFKLEMLGFRKLEFYATFAY